MRHSNASARSGVRGKKGRGRNADADVAWKNAHDQYVWVRTVRITMNVDEELLREVVDAHPGVTKTALVEQGLRALLTKRAASRLSAMGGSAPRAKRAKRSAWKRR